MTTTNIFAQIDKKKAITLSGLRGSSTALLAAQLAKNSSCCCIVPDDHLIPIVVQNLQLFSEKTILSYPSHEIPPYTALSPDQKVTATRLASLYQAANSEHPTIIVTSIEALLRRVIPKELLSARVELIMAGEDCDRDGLITSLLLLGYDKVSLTKNVGDFAVRGGIIDIYPPAFALENGQLHEGPLRLDFFGDTVESLRTFDPVSQRSTGKLEEAILLPTRDFIIDTSAKKSLQEIGTALQTRADKYSWNEELTQTMLEKINTGQGIAGIESFLPLFFPGKNLSSLFDFLTEDTTMVLMDSFAIQQSMRMSYQRIEQNYLEVQGAGTPALPPKEIFLSPEEIKEKLSSFRQVRLSDIVSEQDNATSYNTQSHGLLKQEIARRRAKEGILVPLIERIRQWQEEGHRIVICCRSEKHTKNLAEMLERHHFNISVVPSPLSLPDLQKRAEQREILLCDHPLSEGFSLPEQGWDIISESELFGQMRLGSKKSKSKKWAEPIEFTELNEGDIVVHRDHGLGIYRGLNAIRIQEITNDFMSIEYRDDDKLYVPVDRLNLVSRYQGISDREPRIDKLGSQNWRNTTKKVKEEVWKVAHELLEIYAKRELKAGRAFAPPGQLYQELEESFPFDETAGQLAAINSVLDDLTDANPMDRLVCGDVGYGKTEVAIRGAFKVVEDGAQAAILVPTTVLAEQHLKTFRERLQNFPLRIECLNRFRTAKEQREIVKDLAAGKIDIVIGTHRLLSKDVQFKDLGLLIIDEEHRFGVAHKERLRKMRAEVDILTLTATPIPRTLQMSLLSIRDLSVISSPPEQRRPVKTFVAEDDDLVIKEAISRELRRKGQTFFVHNRVKSIYQIANKIEKLVPDARIAVAHGQMDTKELENIMVSFVNKEVDVLVATTIIESGLDIPSANTMIINRADNLGLAEMYQLRGRVGRSSTQSFAYLLVPSLDSISKDSRERLRALMECNELGGGFKLAMNDLQIRGGGNLLGISQSGNIAAIGYDLYLDLLQKTVADLKAQKLSQEEQGIYDDLDPEINLQHSAFIPSNYITDIDQRYIVYRRIAAMSRGMADFADIRDELSDRYGRIPAETETLLKMIEVKRELIELRVTKLERGRGNIVLTFQDDTPVQPVKLIAFIAESKATKKQAAPKLTQDGRLIVFMHSEEKDVFKTIGATLIKLHSMIGKKAER
ncbi:transcription-repair coupling factor [Desulfotalea psychrophila]|uniref:Transcription-repair-coupling factor n=1 Tax=Desulfotalea psychrophila (strain LSv54 / DSM 12343) TaxID=177439 RepID=Q6ARL4_DESPS|nr:transcription-repair coupling factor [Desulfotalea psychrophila]CAG35011.1 related to transcription-repair coupling factor [Desulfotalea psychrophila LSv54]